MMKINVGDIVRLKPNYDRWASEQHILGLHKIIGIDDSIDGWVTILLENLKPLPEEIGYNIQIVCKPNEIKDYLERWNNEV